MKTRLLALASLLLLVAACGADDKPTASSSDASTTDAPTTDTPADVPTARGPAFAENAAAQTAENSGEWDLVLMDVRVAEHESFDRIVLEFTGTGIPGWEVNYVGEAVLAGIDGHPVPFRVFALTDPSRLVVDVVDESAD